MSRSRLPALGPHGEGWFAGQMVVFLVIFAAASLGPEWGGGARSVTTALGMVLAALGGLLVLRGFLDLRENLTPFPRPLEGGRLVDSGSYALVRHPIYGGLVIGSAGWALLTASLPALGAAALLLAFFDLKSRREEAWLVEAYPDYEAYRARTRRMIPRIY
jgi:protein-S-isoprenylcysteine O-methyltransferase Ste14